ncbi:DUF3265 domain-containing protein [Vibrio parahaemolyticus]|nr:DUF3265 domain-containing protein [Vibrio parahaemolyticus]
MGKLFNLYGQCTTSFTGAKCRVGFNHAHNKLFKRDSQRVAFFVCGWFNVEVPCSNLVIACFTP